MRWTRLGAERVLVLDWDVHHGNGTNDIFYDTDAVLYASIHQSPLYPGTGSLSENGTGAGEGYTINLPVPPGSGHEEWLSLFEHVVAPVARAYRPDLLLVSAGFDAHRDDPLANCELTEQSYAAMAAGMRALSGELAAPLGFVLEGGYDLRALAASVAATMEAARNGSGSPGVDMLARRDARTLALRPVVARARRPDGLQELPVFAAKRKPRSDSAAETGFSPKRRAPCKHGALAPR